MQKHYIKIKRAKTAIVMMSGFLLLLFSVTFLFPPANTPNKASAAPVTSSSSINIQTIRNLGGITLDVKSQNGTFTASTSEQEAEFAVSTTNLTGYRLYLEGDNSSNDLVDSGSGKILHSIANPTSLINFSSDTSYNNLWGIRPSKYNSHANTDFLPGPTLGESGQIPMDETTSATTGDPTHYTIGIGVRANYDDNVGNYRDTYTIVAVAHPINYAITYSDNSQDTSNPIDHTSFPAEQSDTTQEDTVTLSTKIPTRRNYTFLHWCLGTVTEKGTVCVGTTYDAGAQFPLNRSQTNNVTLYAVWSPNILLKLVLNPPAILQTQLGSHVCNTSAESFNGGDGCVITGLKYSEGHNLSAIVSRGYHLTEWSLSPTGSGTIQDNSRFIVGNSPATITPGYDQDQYEINLTSPGATPASQQQQVKVGNTSIAGIQNPTKTAFTVSGFTADSGNKANDATVTGVTTLTNNYTFTGWWTSTTGGYKVINADKTFVKQNTEYTDANGEWIYNNSGATFHAQWGELTKVTLPTITRTNYTCGWTSIASGATVIEYGSGDEFTPSATGPSTLYGVCNNSHYIVVDVDDDAIVSVTFTDIAGVEPTRVIYKGEEDKKVNLARGTVYSITVALESGYSITGWSLTGYGELDTTTNQVKYTPNINSTGDIIHIGTTNIHPVKVNFSGVTKVTFSRDGESTKTVSTSGESVNLTSNVPYLIKATSSGSNTFSGWTINNASYGTFADPTNIQTTFTLTTGNSDAEITATAESGSITDIEFMQDVTPNIINGTAEGTSKTLTDSRDNKGYTVRKINGNLWMTENLKLNLNGTSCSSGTTTLTPADSNVDRNITLTWQALNTGHYNPGCQYNGTYKSVYYNHAGATAGTIASGTNTSDAVYSICPKGWRLPTMAEAWGVANNLSSFNPMKGGVFGYSSESGTLKYSFLNDNFGRWHTSAASTAGSSYILQYYTYSTNYGFRVGKNTDIDGMFVRCVGNLEKTPMLNMQDTSAVSSYMNSMNEGDSGYLKDSRDGRVYSVAKLSGRLWMTRNLGFTGSVLTSDSSNVAGTVYINWYDMTNSSNTQAMYKDTGTSETGCYYNYAGATAGTVASQSYSSDATYDICPKGWRLPTNTEFGTLSSNVARFLPVNGGLYGTENHQFKLLYTNYGYWYSKTAVSSTNVNRLTFSYTNTTNTLTTVSNTRDDGIFVRCIFAGS